MIAATEKNIEWLIERLYDAIRELQAREINDPFFVLLTKGMEDRIRVTDILIHYLTQRYGLGLKDSDFRDFTDSSRVTVFNLPNLRARIMLMDI